MSGFLKKARNFLTRRVFNVKNQEVTERKPRRGSVLHIVKEHNNQTKRNKAVHKRRANELRAEVEAVKQGKATSLAPVPKAKKNKTMNNILKNLSAPTTKSRALKNRLTRRRDNVKAFEWNPNPFDIYEPVKYETAAAVAVEAAEAAEAASATAQQAAVVATRNNRAAVPTNSFNNWNTWNATNTKANEENDLAEFFGAPQTKGGPQTKAVAKGKYNNTLGEIDFGWGHGLKEKQENTLRKFVEAQARQNKLRKLAEELQKRPQTLNTQAPRQVAAKDPFTFINN